VFISVTTIPAAGNAALALVFGNYHEAAGSALQLIINLTGIVLAAYLVLLARGAPGPRPIRSSGAPAGQALPARSVGRHRLGQVTWSGPRRLRTLSMIGIPRTSDSASWRLSAFRMQ